MPRSYLHKANASWLCPRCFKGPNATPYHLCASCLRKSNIAAAAKRKANLLVRTPAEKQWRMAVSKMTKLAIRLGFLPEVHGQTCADCGRPAECYDHRDYNKPIDVEPVCLPCNASRRKGLMPTPRTFAQKEAA